MRLGSTGGDECARWARRFGRAKRTGRAQRAQLQGASAATGRAQLQGEPGEGGAGHDYKKTAGRTRRLVFQTNWNYLRILRRSTIASAPSPRRLIVAGSGIAVAWMVSSKVVATTRSSTVQLAAPLSSAPA